MPQLSQNVIQGVICHQKPNFECHYNQITKVNEDIIFYTDCTSWPAERETAVDLFRVQVPKRCLLTKACGFSPANLCGLHAHLHPQSLHSAHLGLRICAALTRLPLCFSTNLLGMKSVIHTLDSLSS